jgi:acyl dehydratase
MRAIAGIEELRKLEGEELGVCPWLTVTQAMVDAFAELTHDPQWIHIDVDRAGRESPFGGTIAHGFLTLSLISSLFRETIKIEGTQKMTINYGFNRVRFTSPVRTGARIRLRARLQSMRDVDGGVECAWDVKIEIEAAAKPAIVAEWLTRIYL